jgi:hypothetical protein
MTVQFDVGIRNARLDAVETNIGTAPILKIRTGSPPANVAASATGTVLATLTLPSDWMAAASGGSKALAGTWEDLSADADGSAGHFEITLSDGTTRKMQGTVTATGGGGDMTVNNVVFATGQAFSITAFTLTDGNA